MTTRYSLASFVRQKKLNARGFKGVTWAKFVKQFPNTRSGRPLFARTVSRYTHFYKLYVRYPRLILGITTPHDFNNYCGRFEKHLEQHPAEAAFWSSTYKTVNQHVQTFLASKPTKAPARDGPIVEVSDDEKEDDDKDNEEQDEDNDDGLL